METAIRRTAAQSMSAIPRFAEGGKVVSPWSLKGIANSIKAATTKTPEEVAKDAARAEYRARSAAERMAAKAPPPPAETAAPIETASPRGNQSVLDKRMKDFGQMAEGGTIEGPGTGTSDDVPIMASNGEYVIRAAAVEEVGTGVLDAINALGEDRSTMDDPEDKKPGKYATGGPINRFGTEVPNTPEQQAQLATQTANYVTGAQANAAARPAVQTMAANPVTPQKAALPPLQGNTAYDYVLGDTVNAVKGAFGGASDSFSKGNYSEGIGKLSRGGLDTGVAMAKGAMTPGIAVADAAVGAAKNFARGFMGDTTSGAPATAPATVTQPTNPAAAPALAKPAMPAAPQTSPGAPNPASGSPDEVMPEGKVNVSRQPNGTMSFSGQNITGQPQYTGSAANTMKSGVMNSVPGMPQSEISRILTNPDGTQWSTRDNAVMAANIRDGIDPYRGTSQGQANELKALALSPNGTPGKSNAMKILAMQSDEKRTTGQQQIEKDRNAKTAQLATAKDGREAAASELDIEARKKLSKAQQEYLDAGDDPAKQKIAERKLITLGGKQPNDKGQVISLPDTVGDQGQVIRGGQAVLMPDGTFVLPEQAKAKTTTKAEYDKLPKGASYTAPDGSPRIKG